jgi:carbamoyl-phosphate synthase large subunit
MLASYIARATAVSPDHPVLIDKFLDNALELDVDALSDGKDTYIGGIMEHIEAAGIHSGDSACLLPSRTLKEQHLKTIERITQTLARALKVKGLMNIQLALKDDVIYVLEVNPRGSRTVPFVSKATNIPLAKKAALLMMGRRLKDIIPASIMKEGARMDWVSVKEAVLPWARFPGVDVMLGPEMRSTGEVMGIGRTFAEAFAKSQSAAGTPLPQQGAVLISVRDEDKPFAKRVAKQLVEMGFQIFATGKTALVFQEAGIPVTRVNKIEEGRPHVVDFITNRQVTLVINTPSGKQARSDGHAIRTAALFSNVPIITTTHAALAALEGIENLQQERWTIKPLQGYYNLLKPNKTLRRSAQTPQISLSNKPR